MPDELLKDLPGDLPTFLKRFGTDAKCRAYLVRARWPAGFRCTGCGHDLAYSHKKRLIEECTACGKQHSILAGTIFEQTKSGLAADVGFGDAVEPAVRAAQAFVRGAMREAVARRVVRARAELGMIRADEVFYQVVDPASVPKPK